MPETEPFSMVFLMLQIAIFLTLKRRNLAKNQTLNLPKKPQRKMAIQRNHIRSHYLLQRKMMKHRHQRKILVLIIQHPTKPIIQLQKTRKKMKQFIHTIQNH